MNNKRNEDAGNSIETLEIQLSIFKKLNVLRKSETSKGNFAGKSFVKIRTAKAVLIPFNKEFDPGSGRTLAARLTHASRTEPI